jgi:hypothetical protein
MEDVEPEMQILRLPFAALRVAQDDSVLVERMNDL